jgi:gamma-glutamylcyclotransferase (GGCT)/AIG2-like uncharacterized protein YtfP
VPHANQHYLFVYGNLRRGECNDVAVLDAQTVFVTRAFVRGRLYDQGSFPSVALDPVASWVTGELYMIAPTALNTIDELELQAGNFHRSQAVVHDASGGAWPCWIYLPPSVPTHRHSIIPGGDWVRYRKVRNRREVVVAAIAIGA